MPPGREAVRARPSPSVALADPAEGRTIVWVSWGGTALLAVTSLLGSIDPQGLAAPALVVALVMFFGGTVIFGWSFLVALGRSRELEVGVAGVYGLSGSTPREVRLQLFGSTAAEVVVAVGAAIAQPDSSLVFDFLAVMWGLGLAGLWGARHGAFPPRAAGSTRRSARDR
jgi:hypothetical protein